MQINAGFLPVSLHGALRHGTHGADFSKGKPAEEFQVHDLGETRIHPSKLFEGITDAFKLLVISAAFDDIGAERSNLELTTALLGLAVSSMIDNQ